jgi:hypothetical protein
MALIGLSEAQRILGLSSRGTLHRKVKSGELSSVDGPRGARLVESDGLADRWAEIVRKKGSSASTSSSAAKRRQKARPRVEDSDDGLDDDDGEQLDYNKERALLTREQRKKVIRERERLGLEIKKETEELVYKEDMERAYSAVLLQLTTRGLAAAKLIKTDIPELTDKQIKKIEQRLADVFDGTAEHNYEELEEA